MTRSIQIPLARPRLSDSDIAAAVKVLKSGHFVSGPIVEKFEKALAAYLDVRQVVCVSSGTAALHLGLFSLGIRQGDDVIVPAFSYPATANVVELAGARPVFIDSEDNGFNIDAAKIENGITPRTRAIMVVHNFGWPADMKRIGKIAEKYNLPVLEDAACALGSSVNNTKCGAMGKLSAFSFHPRKILTTGEGGAIATNDDGVADLVRELRNHGQRTGSTDFIRPGFNYRMTEFQAALGNSQLERFDETIKSRQEAADYYNCALNDLDLVKLRLPLSGHAINYQSYVCWIGENLRDHLIEYLKGRDISTGIGTYSIPHTSFYTQKYGYTRDDFPNASRAYHNLISLPLYEAMTKEEQNMIVIAMSEFCREVSAEALTA